MVYCFSAIASQQAYVSDKSAYVWSVPGFSWKECRCENSDACFPTNEDLRLSLERYSHGGAEACQSRGPLLEAGDELEVLTNDKGKPITADKDLIFSGKLVPKKFYKVKVKGKNGKSFIGWISEHQITSPSDQKEAEKEEPEVADSKPCPPVKSKNTNSPKELGTFVKKMRDDISSKIELGPTKSDSEVDRFMCLYRNASINENEFSGLLKKFKKAAKDAESAFQVPYSMTMCTLLVESGLKHNPNENDEYTSYGQFGSLLVEDLQKKVASRPYSAMWNQYKSRNPSAEFTDRAIRKDGSPESATAGVAMALRWIYGERFKDVGCKDCSTHKMDDPRAAPMKDLNRKDLYMMVAGYNFTPYSLSKLKGKTPAALLTSYPPPKETRNYMTQMDRCMEKGQEEQLRVSGKPSKKGKADKKSVSREYKSRIDECNRTHPKS